MLYILIASSNSNAFQIDVNKAIEQGWKPQGGVAIVFNIDAQGNELALYAQAMIREEE